MMTLQLNVHDCRFENSPSHSKSAKVFRGSTNVVSAAAAEAHYTNEELRGPNAAPVPQAD